MKDETLLTFFPLRRFSLCYTHYAIVDVPEHLAERLFLQNRVRVRFCGEYALPALPYRMVFCKCRKKDREAFEAAMDTLPDMMLLCGYSGYAEFCEGFMKSFRKGGVNSGRALWSGKSEAASKEQMR